MMRQTIRYCLFNMFLMALFFLPTHGHSTDTEDTYEMDTITVTAKKEKAAIKLPKSYSATKTAAEAQKTPMSMDVFTADELEIARIETIPKLTRFSPNVHMEEMSIFHYPVIRGMSTFHTSLGTNAGIIADDVFYPVSYMQNLDLVDVEQVEILKGPQGTLYGRNTESGLISIATKQPGNEFRGKISGEYGSYNTYKTGASISGPVVKNKLFLGGSFQYRSSDGSYENLGSGDENPTDLEHLNVRGTLRWTPSDPWDISLMMDYADADDHSGGLRRISGAQKTGPHQVQKDSEEFIRRGTDTKALKIKHKGDWFDFISVSTALNQDLEKSVDNDFSDVSAMQQETVLRVDAEAYSQEFRVSQNNNGPLQWLVGVYFFDEDVNWGNFKQKVSTSTVTSIFKKLTETRGYAVFGQETYTLYEKLHLTAGLRFDHQELDGDINDYLNNKQLSGDLDYNEWLPKISVAYDFTPKAMAYTTVSRGYKAGGFNGKFDESIFSFDPEYLWNYEAGVKTTWLNDRLLVNLSLFYIDLADKQVSEYDESTGESIKTNAGDATSTGFELDLRFKPLPGFDLFAGFGYNDTNLDSFSCTEKKGATFVETDYSGTDLPYAPRYTYNIGAEYHASNGIYVRGDLLGSDKFYGNIENSLEQRAYATVNLRTGYKFKSYEVYLNIDNIFDEEYLTYMNGRVASAIGTDGDPQMITIGVNYNF